MEEEWKVSEDGRQMLIKVFQGGRVLDGELKIDVYGQGYYDKDRNNSLEPWTVLDYLEWYAHNIVYMSWDDIHRLT